jgi:hypothetical protein
MSTTTTHPRLVPARGTASAAAATSHDPDQPLEWQREDTLFVVLLVAAITFCSGIGVFAL